MKQSLLNELSLIEENSTYTAEAHHQIEGSQRKLGNALQVGPAVIAAILGALTATGWLPLYGAWLSAGAAVVTGFANVLNPFAHADAHLRAAKSFAVLKHRARALRDTFSHSMTDDALGASVLALHEKYSDLIRESPPTTDRAFEKARRKIKAGRHEPDNPALKTCA